MTQRIQSFATGSVYPAAKPPAEAPESPVPPRAAATDADAYVTSGTTPPRAASPSAALQYLRGEFDRALKGRSLTSGAKEVNVFDLNAYLAHTDSANDLHVTGREAALRDAITQQVERTGKKLQPGDVLALSLDLNDGNVAKSLITAHNALRALSRGDDMATGVEEQDLEFFHDYLDTRFRTEATTRKTDLSDEWYHLFGMAALGFVSQQKGFWELRKDSLAASNSSLWSAAPIWAGSVLNTMAKLPGGMDALTDWVANRYGMAKTDGAALFDALGEQVVFGVLMNGMDGGWNDALKGALDRIKPGGKSIGEDWGEVLDQLSRGWKRGASAYEADEFKAELYGADLGRHLAKKF
ncbi:hypothetical protein D3C86_598510 [compost metagenome]